MTIDWETIFDAEFERAARELMREWKVPGVAITLVPDDSAIEPLFKIINDEAQSSGPPVTERSRFGVASCSKLVAALALVAALEQNGYDKGLDTRVIDILPEFELSDHTATLECTVRDIIGHQTSIPTYDFFAFRPLRRGETTLDIVRGLPLSRKWQEEGSPVYSNTVQHVVFPMIERLTKRPFEEYVRATLLDPLGMVETGYSAEAAGGDMAQGYQARYTPQGIEDRLMGLHHALDGLGAECGMANLRLITSIKDVAKLLGHLRVNTHFADMARPLVDDVDSTVAHGDIMSQAIFGSGTASLKMGKYLLSGHSGACAGFRSQIFRVPELGFGIGVLTNSTDGQDLAAWIDAWVIGRLTSDADLVYRVRAQISRTRAETIALRTRSYEGFLAVDDRKLCGRFSHPSYGTWKFDESSNLARRPDGVTVLTIPWIPALYGETRPVVTSLGDGWYEGCFEWTPGPGQAEGFGKQYGYTFRIKEEADRIEVYGIDGWAPDADKLPPAVLYRE